MTQLDRILAAAVIVCLLTSATVLGLGDVLDGDRVVALLTLIVGVAVPSPLVTRGNKPTEG